MKRLLCAICVLPLGCHRAPPGPSPAELAQSAQLVSTLKAKYEPLETERRKGLAAALAGAVVARSDLGACPVTVDLANPLDHKDPMAPQTLDLDRMMRQARALARVTIDRFPTADEVSQFPGPLWSSTLNLFDEASRERPDQARTTLADVEASDYWNWDLTIVKLSEEKAEKEGDSRFTGGTFRGKALLWSFEKHAVVCEADVDMQLGKVSYTKYGSSDDFDLSAGVGMGFLVMREARDKLFAAGPPAEPVASAGPARKAAPKKKAR